MMSVKAKFASMAAQHVRVGTMRPSDLLHGARSAAHAAAAQGRGRSWPRCVKAGVDPYEFT